MLDIRENDVRTIVVASAAVAAAAAAWQRQQKAAFWSNNCLSSFEEPGRFLFRSTELSADQVDVNDT